MMTAFTTQVLPSTTAALLMFCTSSSMNAAPRKKKCQSDRPQAADRLPRLESPHARRRTAAPARPRAGSTAPGCVGVLEVDVRPVVGRQLVSCRSARIGCLACHSRDRARPAAGRRRCGRRTVCSLSPTTNISPAPAVAVAAARGTRAARGRTPRPMPSPCGRRCNGLWPPRSSAPSRRRACSSFFACARLSRV